VRVPTVVVAVLLCGAVGGVVCGVADGAAAADVPLGSVVGPERLPPASGPVVVTASFADTGVAAVTYDPRVPVGAGVAVFAVSAAAGTTVALVTRGLLPGREYGAHVHAAACGAVPAAAGPHFQHDVDPVSPSVDPRYANPRNEIWLDLTTDRAGNGFAHSAVRWSLDDRRPGSVVIHETHTHTEPGHAGTAGARLACVTVPF